MKLNISVEDLMELTEEQKEKLRVMWEPEYGEKVYYENEGQGVYTDLGKEHTLPLLSIGQMIEILSEHSSILNIQRYDDCNGNQWNVRGTLYRSNDRHYETLEGDDDLVKALWLAVKNIL